MAFVIFSLPRSRTAWLSRFLSYGGWFCGHDEIRHARSLDDVKAWFSQPNIGTVETAGAPWWRLLDRFAPGAKVAVVRRPVDDVVASLMKIPGLAFDEAALRQHMWRLDRKLDQVARRVPGVLSVNYTDLEGEQGCRAIFEHCLPYKLETAYWEWLAPTNLQIDMRALSRYIDAYRPALERLALIAKHQTLAAMALKKAPEPGHVTFQSETFDDWIRDSRHTFDDHLVTVGEPPGNWKNKNLPMMEALYNFGAMQIMTARCNGRVIGYLMTVISPSLVTKGLVSATNLPFYVSPEFPGMGMKLQRAAIIALKERGIGEVFWEAGTRGSGPRLGSMYQRLGAAEHGRTYRLDLTEH